MSLGKDSMETPMPHILENVEDFSDSDPKDRLVRMLDRIEMHVEQLRKDAFNLEEKKDSLLTTLDTLRNTDVVVSLADRKFFMMFNHAYTHLNKCIF